MGSSMGSSSMGGGASHIEPSGIVPLFVSHPSLVVLNSIWLLLLPPQRKMELPTKSSGVLRKVSSVRGASAGASLYA
jgi:hypothetical protein